MDEADILGDSPTVTAWDDDMENKPLPRSLFS
jgi:hypothetical protein